MASPDHGSNSSLERFLENALGRVAAALGSMCQPTWDVAFQVAADLNLIGLEAARYDREELKQLAIQSATASRLWASGGIDDSQAILANLKALGGMLIEELHSLALGASMDSQPDRGIAPRLIVVDDSRVSAAALANAFAGNGFSVRAVTKMEEAVELFFSFAPHVLVSDVFMPEVNVVELCRRFRLATVNTKAFIVLVSASNEADLHARLDMIKPDAFVPKVAGATAVLAKVKEFCCAEKL